MTTSARVEAGAHYTAQAGLLLQLRLCLQSTEGYFAAAQAAAVTALPVAWPPPALIQQGCLHQPAGHGENREFWGHTRHMQSLNKLTACHEHQAEALA